MAEKLPEDSLLSRLADIIEGRRAKNASPPETFAAKLGLAHTEVEVVSVEVDEPTLMTIANHLTSRYPQADWVGVMGNPPEWRSIPIGEDVYVIPWSAGIDVELDGGHSSFLWVGDDGFDSYEVAIVTVPGGRDAAGRLLDDVVTQAKGPDNLWRGRHLRAALARNGYGIGLYSADFPQVRRDDVILDDVCWKVVDGDIHRFLDRLDTLKESGLGGSRGILLSGPPGVGKSAFIDAVVAEVADRVTVLRADPAVLFSSLVGLYKLAAELAPTVVVLEDVDLALQSRRGGGGSNSLLDFLMALDRVADADGVITLATTNDPDRIDEAAGRSARIDRHIKVDLPGPRARRRLFEMFLDRLPAKYRPQIDEAAWSRIVSRSEGSSGADIRERIRRALIETDEAPIPVEALTVTPDRQISAGDIAGGNYL